MKNLTTQEATTFTYNEWLSMELGENRTLEWEMPAVINEEQMMQYTTYTVQVKTSDSKGTLAHAVPASRSIWFRFIRKCKLSQHF